jgi:hypothetical protein
MEKNKEVEEQSTSDLIQIKKSNFNKKSILQNVLGEDVSEADYFFNGVVPSGFLGTCGKPVDREDLIEIFHKVFNPKDNILFYKQLDKEVYIVIIPIKYSSSIGEHNNSIDGDFQKHAISFLSEGSVNADSMKQKLQRIKKFVKYDDR